MRRLGVSLPIFLAASAAVLVPWSVWLATSLPCRYVSRHWGIAWAGFDLALATALALTSVAAFRRAPWLDRAAAAAATLLAADAWFDVVTSDGVAARAIATGEAVAVELPVACLCIWLARHAADHSHAPTSGRAPAAARGRYLCAPGSTTSVFRGRIHRTAIEESAANRRV